MATLPRLFLDPFRRLPPNFRQHLRDWFRGAAGQRVLLAEQQVLDDITPCIFGYHAAQVCSVGTVSLMGGSRILNRALLATDEDAALGAQAICRPQQLPLGNDTTDLLILHHCLDFEDSPYQVLREAARAVIPGGALVVVGFNPWSLFGFLRLFRLGGTSAPWFARTLSPYRVTDWLRVLDFRVDGLESSYYLPPLEGERAVARLSLLQYLGGRWWPQRGMFYVLVARKSVAPLTPVRRFERQSRPMAVGVPVTSRVTRNRDPRP